MPVNLFRFLLSEITLVRIRCQASGCDGVVELPLEKLRTRFPDCRCPLCQQQFGGTSYQGDHILSLLARVLIELNAMRHKVEVEIDLPSGTDKK